MKAANALMRARAFTHCAKNLRKTINWGKSHILIPLSCGNSSRDEFSQRFGHTLSRRRSIPMFATRIVLCTRMRVTHVYYLRCALRKMCANLLLIDYNNILRCAAIENWKKQGLSCNLTQSFFYVSITFWGYTMSKYQNNLKNSETLRRK